MEKLDLRIDKPAKPQSGEITPDITGGACLTGTGVLCIGFGIFCIPDGGLTC